MAKASSWFYPWPFKGPGTIIWQNQRDSLRRKGAILPPQVIVSHFLFAAATAGLSVVLIVALMTAIFLRYIHVAEAQDKPTGTSTVWLKAGGIGMVGAFLAAIWLIHVFGRVTPIEPHRFWGFLLSLFLIASLELYGTLRPLNSGVKLAGQTFAAAIVMMTGVVIDQIHLPWIGAVIGGLWVYPMTLAWIIGLTNAYARFDRVHGLASVSAVIASGFFSYIAFRHESVFIYLCSISLFSAALGFLAVNWPSVKIYLGDIGSAFLGFSFAVMAIIAALYDRSHTSLYVIPLLLFHLIFDALFSISIRILAPNFFKARTWSTLGQLLAILGSSHRTIVLFYSSMAIAQGIGAIVMVNIPGSMRILVFLPFLLLQLLFSFALLRRARQMGFN